MFLAIKLTVQKELVFYIKEQVVIIATILYGGSQEKKTRAGTENVPAVVAFAKAVEIASEQH